MKLRIEFRPGVAEDFADAIAWYENEQPGLGERLFAAVEATLTTIATAPDVGAPWDVDRTVRRQAVWRFPYVVFYRANDDVATVLAIAHGKRRPGYWT